MHISYQKGMFLISKTKFIPSEKTYMHMEGFPTETRDNREGRAAVPVFGERTESAACERWPAR
jgi:hypothetical protein